MGYLKLWPLSNANGMKLFGATAGLIDAFLMDSAHALPASLTIANGVQGYIILALNE